MAKRAEKPVVFAYMRVSSDRQSVEGQELEIRRHVAAKGWVVRASDWIVNKVSSRKGEEERGIDKLKSAAEAGKVNVVVFSELSRLGRSISQIVRYVDFFRSKGVALIFLKEGIDTSRDDLTTKIQISVFSLMAEIERDLISVRTKEALAARKASGCKLGRPAGVSKLDPHEPEIRYLVELGVRQKSLAERFGCSQQTMCHWLQRAKKRWLALGATTTAATA